MRKKGLLEELTNSVNNTIGSYYEESKIERPKQIIYDASDNSFCSKSIDSDSQISSEDSSKKRDSVPSATLNKDE